MIERPGLVIALGVVLVAIGAALLMVLAANRRARRQPDTPGRGGRVYRSANAARRRARGGGRG